MRARVINYPAGPVTAFGGYEFVNYEWRAVPDGFEEEAERHPFLEIDAVVVRAPVATEPESELVEVAEPEEEPVPEPDPLPENIPGYEALVNFGVDSLEAVPDDRDELVAVPGIGTATANKILAYLEG